MAYVNIEYCRFCEGERMHVNNRCSDCAERVRREQMGKWISKTTDEKLLDIHKRLLKLESSPIRC